MLDAQNVPNQNPEALFALWQQYVGSADGPYCAHNTRTDVIVLYLNII
jgi:hypothetical protein